MRLETWKSHKCNHTDTETNKKAKLYARIKDEKHAPKSVFSQKALEDFAKLNLDPKQKPVYSDYQVAQMDLVINPIAADPNQPLASVMDDQRPMKFPVDDTESLIDASYAATYH